MPSILSYYCEVRAILSTVSSTLSSLSLVLVVFSTVKVAVHSTDITAVSIKKQAARYRFAALAETKVSC